MRALRIGSLSLAAIAAGFVILASTSRADVVFPPKGNPKQSDADYKKDQQRFLAMVDACAAKSPAFRDFYVGVVNKSLVDKSPQGGLKSDKKIHVDVKLVHEGAFVDNAESRGGGGKITVNLDNLERLPDPDVDKDGKLKTPPGTSWGMTRCELIAHFLKEAAVSANSFRDLGKLAKSAHDAGIALQNKVRDGFKQHETNPCRSSVLPNGHGDNDTDKVQPLEVTYKDKDGKTHTFTPKNQVQVDYGGGVIQVLWFDSDGKIQMAFFKNKKQIPRENVVMPGDDPAKKILNPSYAMRTPAAGGEAPLAVAGACRDLMSPALASAAPALPTPPPAPAPPAPLPEPKKECHRGGGLVGAMEDVGCKIENGG